MEGLGKKCENTKGMAEDSSCDITVKERPGGQERGANWQVSLRRLTHCVLLEKGVEVVGCGKREGELAGSGTKSHWAPISMNDQSWETGM